MQEQQPCFRIGVASTKKNPVFYELPFKVGDTVFVPPFKVGDTVFVPWKYAFARGIASVLVEEIKFYDSQNHFMFLIDMQSDDETFNQSFGGWKTGKSVGDTVFLTREEAENKLEEMQKNDY